VLTAGQTGGVTLTLSVAYLSVLAHQRNRQRQGEILRANAHVLNALSSSPDAPPPELPPTRAERLALRRAGLVETAKETWNAEVEGAVRWVFANDWARAREDLEDTAAGLWARAFGESPAETVARGEHDVAAASAQAAQKAREKAGEAGVGVAAAARSALETTRAPGRDAAAAVEDGAAAAQSAVQKGVQKGREAAAQARAVVGLAEDRLEARTAAAVLPLSDVERALRQRYDGSGARQSAEEAWGARYRPLDRRETPALRVL